MGRILKQLAAFLTLLALAMLRIGAGPDPATNRLQRREKGGRGSIVSGTFAKVRVRVTPHRLRLGYCINAAETDTNVKRASGLLSLTNVAATVPRSEQHRDRLGSGFDFFSTPHLAQGAPAG